MANFRDYRRRAYFDALRQQYGTAFAESTSDLDQVLYHPRRLVCAGLEGDPRGAADPDLLTAVSDVCHHRVHAKEPSALSGLQRCVVDLPDSDDADSCQLASQLKRDFPDRVAPLLYAVTQQFVRPGEDPEPSQPAPELLASAQSRSSAGGGLGRGIRIGVIDTGIDPTAIDAAALGRKVKFSKRADVDPLDDPTAAPASLLGPAAGHGTFISSLICAVAPGATVRNYRVTGPLGVAHEADIAKGIRRAVKDEVHVINLSIGGYPFLPKEDDLALPAFSLLEAAVAEIPEHIAVVAAAGNSGSSDKFYPAAFPGVIGVAALDSSNRLWEHSNYGDWVRACARGAGLRGLFVRGEENPAYDADGTPEKWDDLINFASWSGTSFAAPLVAAQIAVFTAAMNLESNPRQAAELLLATSRPPLGSKPCGNRVLVDVPGQT